MSNSSELSKLIISSLKSDFDNWYFKNKSLINDDIDIIIVPEGNHHIVDYGKQTFELYSFTETYNMVKLIKLHINKLDSDIDFNTSIDDWFEKELDINNWTMKDNTVFNTKYNLSIEDPLMYNIFKTLERKITYILLSDKLSENAPPEDSISSLDNTSDDIIDPIYEQTKKDAIDVVKGLCKFGVYLTILSAGLMLLGVIFG